MSRKKPTVLITGANGFIGSELCRRFAAEDLEVIAGVRETSDRTLIEKLPLTYRRGDVTKPATLPAMVVDVDYIVHNAGLVKAKTDKNFFEVNEEGTRNLFDAVAEHNPDIRKVVYVSSVAVAGPSRPGRPVLETDPPNPVTVYGRSKAAGEEVALSYRDRLPVVSVRPPAVYGPGDREMFTIFKAVYNRFVPFIGDMTRRLQLVHVDDLSRGIFLATTRDTPSGAIYFIAEQASYTVREMMISLQQAAGRRAISVPLPGWLFKLISAVSEASFRLVGATPMLTLDKTRELLEWWEVSTERAKNELGFESAITLAQGAEETYQWYIKREWL